MASRPMLTTVDNPWSPFTHYPEWESFDRLKGYNTASFLARVSQSSYNISETDQEQALEDAIDDIVRLNPLGKYRKVYE